MAKQIVAWCDPHMENDENVPAKSFQISINGAKPVEIDLCEEHEKALVTPLRELLGDAGQPLDKVLPGMPEATRTPGGGGPKQPCPTCTKPLTREGMRKHIMREHEKERAEAGDIVREVFGSVRRQNVGNYTCPECKEPFDTPQGMGAHRRSVHNVKGESSKAAKK